MSGVRARALSVVVFASISLSSCKQAEIQVVAGADIDVQFLDVLGFDVQCDDLSGAYELTPSGFQVDGAVVVEVDASRWEFVRLFSLGRKGIKSTDGVRFDPPLPKDEHFMVLADSNEGMTIESVYADGSKTQLDRIESVVSKQCGADGFRDLAGERMKGADESGRIDFRFSRKLGRSLKGELIVIEERAKANGRNPRVKVFVFDVAKPLVRSDPDL